MQGHKVFDSEVLRRRMQGGGTKASTAAPARDGTKKELSPYNTKSAGSMLKKNIKPAGSRSAVLKRLGNGPKRA